MSASVNPSAGLWRWRWINMGHGENIQVHGDDLEHVAEIEGRDAKAEERARLIAAAPELFKALKDAVEALSIMMPPAKELIDESTEWNFGINIARDLQDKFECGEAALNLALEAARAAIAKAKGETKP